MSDPTPETQETPEAPQSRLRAILGGAARGGAAGLGLGSAVGAYSGLAELPAHARNDFREAKEHELTGGKPFSFAHHTDAEWEARKARINHINALVDAMPLHALLRTRISKEPLDALARVAANAAPTALAAAVPGALAGGLEANRRWQDLQLKTAGYLFHPDPTVETAIWQGLGDGLEKQALNRFERAIQQEELTPREVRRLVPEKPYATMKALAEHPGKHGLLPLRVPEKRKELLLDPTTPPETLTREVLDSMGEPRPDRLRAVAQNPNIPSRLVPHAAATFPSDFRNNPGSEMALMLAQLENPELALATRSPKGVMAEASAGPALHLYLDRSDRQRSRPPSEPTPTELLAKKVTHGNLGEPRKLWYGQQARVRDAFENFSTKGVTPMPLPEPKVPAPAVLPAPSPHLLEKLRNTTSVLGTRLLPKLAEETPVAAPPEEEKPKKGLLGRLLVGGAKGGVLGLTGGALSAAPMLDDIAQDADTVARYRAQMSAPLRELVEAPATKDVSPGLLRRLQEHLPPHAEHTLRRSLKAGRTPALAGAGLGVAAAGLGHLIEGHKADVLSNLELARRGELEPTQEAAMYDIAHPLPASAALQHVGNAAMGLGFGGFASDLAAKPLLGEHQLGRAFANMTEGARYPREELELLRSGKGYIKSEGNPLHRGALPAMLTLGAGTLASGRGMVRDQVEIDKAKREIATLLRNGPETKEASEAPLPFFRHSNHGLGAALTLGGLGALEGARHGYNKGREEGRGYLESIGQGTLYGLGGAAAGGLGGAGLNFASGRAGKYVSQMGQGILHGVTGWLPKDPRTGKVMDYEKALAAMDIGRPGARQELAEARALLDHHNERVALPSHAALSPEHQASLAARGEGLKNKVESLEAWNKNLENPAMDRAAEMQLSSIPGHIAAVRKHGVLPVLGASMREQWALSPGVIGKGMVYGMPALGLASAALSEDDGHKGERVSSALLGGATNLVGGGLTMGFQNFVANPVLNRVAGLPGRLVDKVRGGDQYEEPEAPIRIPGTGMHGTHY